MNHIKRARIAAGMTQGELAKKLGVSLVTIWKWEMGYALPRVSRLKDVAGALNVTVAELLDDYETRAV